MAASNPRLANPGEEFGRVILIAYAVLLSRFRSNIVIYAG